MVKLAYITEKNGECYELIPNWNAIAILSSNGIQKMNDSNWELHPKKAFMFSDVNVCELFIQNFHKINHSYNEILPENTEYYVIHDLSKLKTDQYNYADCLVSRV